MVADISLTSRPVDMRGLPVPGQGVYLAVRYTRYTELREYFNPFPRCCWSGIHGDCLLAVACNAALSPF